MKTFSPMHVSNNILKRSFDEGLPISAMKLQKLMFISASEYAKSTGGQPLLHEQFRSWITGPALRTIYDKFLPFGRGAITAYNRDAAGIGTLVDEERNPEFTAAIDRVWFAAKHLTAAELARITSLPGSAWQKAFEKPEECISDEDTAADTTYASALNLEAHKLAAD